MGRGYRPDLDKLKLLVEEHDGNKAKVARLLNYSEKYIRTLCRAIKDKYPSWEHYRYIGELSIPTIFATNEERLSYADRPEKNMTKLFHRVKCTYNYFEDEHVVGE